MASINEVIERVDRLVQNPWSEEEKARWLLELEGRLWREAGQGRGEPPPAAWPQDGDMPLLVPAPYDGLYDLHLQAMMDYYAQEYDHYAVSRTMAEAALTRWRTAHRRATLPPAGGGYQNIV